MIPLLTELSEYLERFADVTDGPYGLEPDRAMLLKRDVDAAIERLKIAAPRVSASESDARAIQPAVAATTPRTDSAAVGKWLVGDTNVEMVRADFARQLERELSEAQAAAALHENAAGHLAQMAVDARRSRAGQL